VRLWKDIMPTVGKIRSIPRGRRLLRFSLGDVDVTRTERACRAGPVSVISSLFGFPYLQSKLRLFCGYPCLGSISDLALCLLRLR